MTIVEKIRAAGVVGAGGAGFPTHVKMQAKAEYIIANGAECEPLLRVDQLLMQAKAPSIVRGLEVAMQATGAKQGVIATKAHYEQAVEALRHAIEGHEGISLHLMDSYYPSGDEKSIIFEVTGRVVPTGKLPADVGCVVSNVATLSWIAAAAEGRPVTDRDVTIGGDVPQPVTVTVPIGTSMRDVISLSGFKGTPDTHALIVGGPCMGRWETDWDAPITKTTGGLLLLPLRHPLIAKRAMPVERQLKLAKAVCCQCSQCTQLCPRHAMGLGSEPHKAMRAIATGNGQLLGGAESVLGCSSCGLCTNYACNFGLSPSNVMALLKQSFAEAGIKPTPEEHITPDPFAKLKHVPVKRLISRMGLTDYDVAAPYQPISNEPRKVVLLLRQHVGKPAEPVVKVGDIVQRGDLVAEIPKRALSARVHASISGKVTAVTAAQIEITGGEGV